MKIVKSNRTGFLLLVVLFYSCNSNYLYSEYEELPNEGWSSEISYDFKLEIEPGQDERSCDYLIALRHNNDYRYANIFFFVDTKSPDGKLHRDTLQYLLAEPSGKWLGNGVGEIKHHLFEFKQDQLMTAGVHEFSITHGMRDEVLMGIEDIGLRIEQLN